MTTLLRKVKLILKLRVFTNEIFKLKVLIY